MTDLEMTRLCAEAMGLSVTLHPIRGTIMRYWFMEGSVEREYAPLHDDAQAMALVKKFYLLVNNGVGSSSTNIWHVQTQDDKDESIENADLNRAIVECVAKMQAAKGQP